MRVNNDATQCIMYDKRHKKFNNYCIQERYRQNTKYQHVITFSVIPIITITSNLATLLYWLQYFFFFFTIFFSDAIHSLAE